MDPNNPRTAVLAFALLLAAGIPARGSVARAVSFDQKVETADSIILGRCTRTHSAWDPTHRWILTYSTFQVEKAIKGPAVPEITVVTPGGQVGSIRQETVGVPGFAAGDQNVLFVKSSAIGPAVLYLDQGVYRVDADKRGEITVVPVASNLVLIDSQTGRATAESARTLRQFEREVHEALERAERRRVRQYTVTPAEKRAEKSPAAQLFEFAKEHRLAMGLLLIAIAITTYLFLKGR